MGKVHFLSKNKLNEETVELDVSFLHKYLGKIIDINTELMLLKNYSLRSKEGFNTIYSLIRRVHTHTC